MELLCSLLCSLCLEQSLVHRSTDQIPGNKETNKFSLSALHLGSSKMRMLHTALGPRPKWAHLTLEQA